MDDNKQKKIEQAEYRARLIEAELNAVKSSKAYKVSKLLGIIKAQLKSDPVGLSRKAARILLREPTKLLHPLRIAKRGAFMAESVVEQTAKYQEWILLNEPDEAELNQQRESGSRFKHQPLISIITPVFNPPVDVLEELIESVLEQTYSNFELCLGNFGDHPEVEKLISKYARLDKRVRHFTFTENKGIAGNSNQILEKVNGEFIALLDHDDTLAPNALYENVKLLNEKPYDFIYSDKDKIDEKGNRFDPLFKATLSPEMLLNINYLTHLNVMRTSIVKSIGGWDPDTDGAQDWDLFLRVIEASKYIGFIPKVLYHWRVIATSTAMSIETKPYALAGQRKAIDKYLKNEHIPAVSYHERTELFLKWDPKALDMEPLVFVRHSNVPNTLRTIRHIRKATRLPEFVVLVEGAMNKQVEKLANDKDIQVLNFAKGDFAGIFSKCIHEKGGKRRDRTALFISDIIHLPKKSQWYEDLAGWLVIPGVAAASGRLVDRQELIVSSGGVATPDNRYFPIFHGYPRYYQSYIGNAEWVRNLSVLSSVFCATKLEHLKSFDFTACKTAENPFDEFFMELSQKYRLVMTPHATAEVENRDIDVERPLPFLEKDYQDKYNNPNLSPSDPMRLFEDERLIGISHAQASNEPVDQYQHDATILASTFDITSQEIMRNKKIIESNKTLQSKSVAWFLPAFDGVYAGLMNIFSFANFLVETQKLETTFYILKADKDTDTEKDLIVTAFPKLKAAKFVAIRPDKTDSIKTHDMGIATQWATTYPLAKTSLIKRKCYFIQDNEANFYPKGSISALVELSYRFGFTAIAGTEGLLNMYKKQYKGNGVVLKSFVDLSAYHPRPDKYYLPKKPYKVFFYARPNMPRNAFELGIAGLKRLKQEFGADIEIITAGASWDAATYGAEGLFTNLGKIAYGAVPKLYRSVDAGLMFMFSGHPGVTASELMASGCPVVVNEYDDVTWHELYQHEKTCLITEATASEVARNLKRCLVESELRRALITNGLIKSTEFYSGYKTSQRVAAEAICRPKAG